MTRSTGDTMSDRNREKRWPLYDKAINAGRFSMNQNWWPELAALTLAERAKVKHFLLLERHQGSGFLELPSEAAERERLERIAADEKAKAKQVTNKDASDDQEGPQGSTKEPVE